MARLRERIEAHKLDDPQAEIKQYYSTGKKIKRIPDRVIVYLHGVIRL